MIDEVRTGTGFPDTGPMKSSTTTFIQITEESSEGSDPFSPFHCAYLETLLSPQDLTLLNKDP